MASTADTLTATGAPVTLAPPPPETSGSSTTLYTQAAFAVMGSSPDQIAVLSYANAGSAGVQLSSYRLDGSLLFRDALASSTGSAFQLATAGGGGVMALWSVNSGPATYETAVFGDGSLGRQGLVDFHSTSTNPLLFSAPSGVHVEMIQTHQEALSPPDGPYVAQIDLNVAGGQTSTYSTPGAGEVAYVHTLVGTSDLFLQDNQVRLASQAIVTVPGEPAHAMTEAVAAGLAGGTTAAVAWADSGTDYVSIFDASTNSFGPTIGLDWGGAKDLHTVALADGGFAVSWSNNGQYKGELFTADGTGGGVLPLTGQFAALDSHGELYTVGLDSSGAEVVQTYTVNSGGSTGGGQTYTSDNAGDHWTGTAGNDTFNLGRGGDVATGNGGDDTFKFAETPWAGGHITDFNIGDQIDLTGLLSASGYAGSDPVGAGYLKLTTDSQGNGQIWADYNQSGNNGWWLVTTVDGVGAYDLQLQNGVITHVPGPSSDGTVSTADPNYQAPAGVTKIILTGSHQTVTGNNAGDTFVSDNTSNHLIGGIGNDTFDLGRDGDIVTGGAGADTFVYQETPWNGGRITDFSVSQGDRIDLNAVLAHAGYTSGDPIAEGYIKILDSSNTGAQIWADPDGPGSASGWWLVDTLGPVSAGAISLSGGMITGGGNGAVIVEDTSYVASRTAVTSITLTGSSPQKIFGNDLGDTFHDNNNANLLISGSGNDTFVLGLGGSSVSTGEGADTVVINGVPSSHESITSYTAGTDRIDLRGLLSSIGSTGSDPFHDGHLELVNKSDGSGQYIEMLAYDPAHGQWTDVVQIYNTTPSQLHYSDGWLT